MLAKLINGYCSKLIDKTKEVRILKPEYKVEERSVEKIYMMCNPSIGCPTLNYGSVPISTKVIFFETGCARLKRP